MAHHLQFIRRYVSTREDAEDVLIEVFIAAFERNNLANFSESEQLVWLRQVAHNKCVDIHHRMSHQSVIPLEEVTEMLTFTISLARFLLEHPFRFVKQFLNWT